MRMKNLLNGLTALTLGLVVVSCSSDDGLWTKEDIMNHANQQFGIKIDPNQDWSMISEANASITVNQDFGETYSIQILRDNPLSGVGYVLASGKISNGETLKTKFTYPKGTSSFMVGITNSKGYTMYMPAYVLNGEMQVTFGGNTIVAQKARRAATRAVVEEVDEYGFDVAEVPGISVTPTDDYAKSYLEGATEPNSQNVVDDYDNTTYATNWGEGGPNYIDWNDPQQVADRKYFFGEDGNTDTQEQRIAWALQNHPTWISFNKDETYVTKFKITNEWNDLIDVLGRRATSIYVSGTWNLPNGQDQYNLKTAQANAGSVIIVDNQGTINIPKNAKLILANQARLVVMPGGKITGEGTIEVTNGTDHLNALDNYNIGEISVGTLNNNMGRFFNYGILNVDVLAGGGKFSNYYNHGKMTVKVASSTGSGSANTRIYNACWFECEGMLEARDIILGPSSYMHTDQLKVSASNDESGDPAEILLGEGAYLKVDKDASFNNVSVIGPTGNVYSVVELGSVSYYNYTPYWSNEVNQNVPEAGVVVNSVALSVDDTSAPDDGQTYNEYNWSPYEMMAKHMLNGLAYPENKVQGNGKAVLVEKGKADLNIEEGDCTPGYEGEPGGGNTEPFKYTYAFEDTKDGDYDMNDCVFQVWDDPEDENYYYIQPVACGARADIKVFLGDENVFNDAEFHTLFQNSAAGYFINTCTYPDERRLDCELITPLRKQKPEGFSYLTADFWIEASTWDDPEGIHIAREGDSPYAIVVPGGSWEWPSERTCVNVAYSDFNEWAADVTYEEGFNWYESGEGQNIYDGRILRYSR